MKDRRHLVAVVAGIASVLAVLSAPAALAGNVGAPAPPASCKSGSLNPNALCIRCRGSLQVTSNDGGSFLLSGFDAILSAYGARLP